MKAVARGARVWNHKMKSVHEPRRIVLDTNVLAAGLQSKRGASNLVIELIMQESVELHLSNALFIQYRDVLTRRLERLAYSKEEIDRLLRNLCAIAHYHEIYFLWRTFLQDRGDDLILELAVAARASWIVTFNQRDFRGCEAFGVQAISPVQLLEFLEEGS